MRVLVQKFGGTSVATPEKRRQVVQHVRKALEDGYAVVAVASAMGRRGEPYATDSLLELLAREAGGAPDPREQDQLVACGEIIACAVLSQALIRQGIPAVSLTGAQAGILTEGRHADARILQIRTERLHRELSGGRVPVVAGFQGVTEEGEVTTLGRGGSDTTAAALGVALGAELVEIFTDVDGIKAADPRVVPDAPTLASVAYREAAELAHLGARVVHPRAVEIAMEGHVPLRIRQTGSDHPGTLVWDRPAGGTMEIRSDRPVVGIAHVGDLAQVVVGGRQDFNQDALHSRLLQAVARKGVSIDLILVSPHQLMFSVPEPAASAVHEALAEFDVEVAVTRKLAKVSVVGAGMHGVPGIMARVARALTGAGVAILQTSDSHASISCLIDGERLGDAIRALFEEFELGRGA
ncbi:aspartate kinase [Carboxydochorda subterranea]|uniref:Aspartokinase n=1 Tax=Carboxydichorda subterranea TaxID=3109565 RepID=A0ABZ1C2H1_9FIRM|nr:aspartate kinase [Limnochorda sp. L945t]WRP18358.1 aspartate kinase [Limnochorda sp. L945t]